MRNGPNPAEGNPLYGVEVLLTGGINDVSLTRILNPGTSKTQLKSIGESVLHAGSIEAVGGDSGDAGTTERADCGGGILSNSEQQIGRDG